MSSPEERFYKAIMSDRESKKEDSDALLKRRKETIAALQEEKKFLDIAKDYRSMSMSEFFNKYQDEFISGPDFWTEKEFIESVDAGLETLDWIR